MAQGAAGGPLSRPTLPGTPPVAGLSFRTYQGDEDIPAIAELLRASYAASGDTMGVSEDELRSEARHSPHADPREDMILGFIGGRLVARSWIDWGDTSDGSARYYQSWGDIHPTYRRQGIGGAMWQRNMARLRAVAAGHDFTAKRLLTVPWLREGDVGGAVLAERFGYRRVRIYQHMTRSRLDDIEVPLLPDGLEVRPVDEAQLPAVWAAMTEAFRDHFGAFDAGPESYRIWLESPMLDPSLLVIAFDGEEIAAGAHGEIDPDENDAQGYLRGWADPIYTRRPWRRRGLASALIGRALVLLRERGMTSAQLDVDSENVNQARSLYERHGFVSDRSASEWHRGVEE